MENVFSPQMLIIKKKSFFYFLQIAFYNPFSIFRDIIKTSNSFPAGYAKIWILRQPLLLDIKMDLSIY